MDITADAPKSALRTFLDEIVNDQREFIHTELEAFKGVCIAFLEKSKGAIREQDRRKMVMAIQREQTLSRLQLYIYNSLLAFEGLRVVDLLKR